MARPDKEAAVGEIAEAFRSSNAAVLTEYRGLSVKEITELRRSLGEGVQYAVVKNTLTKIAATEAGVGGLDGLLQGPTAVAFVTGDPVEAAKSLRDFARTHPLLVVKGGVLEGKALSPDEIRRLADLESREVLLAKLAGAMKASLSQAVGLFAAPLSQAARLMAALQAKAEEDPSILGGGAAPAGAATAAEATPAGGTAEDPAASEDGEAPESAAPADGDSAAGDSAAGDSAAGDSAAGSDTSTDTQTDPAG